MQANQAIILARKNLGGDMESSARFCLADAIRLYDEGKHDYAKQWAVRSLAYSVGIFHPDYKQATK